MLEAFLTRLDRSLSFRLWTRRARPKSRSRLEQTYDSLFELRQIAATSLAVDNRGEHLTGCLTCNVWWSRWSANAVKLSEEDLHALHELRRTKTPE